MKLRCCHLGILSALAAVGAGACVGPPDAVSGETGNGTASLQLSPTTTLTTASYSITGPNAFVRSGTVDVSRSQTISVTEGNIPAGSGYTATITATATDGVTSCSGSGMFAVSTKMTTVLMIPVQCREPARTGSVQINGTFNVCPVVDGIGVNPGDVIVGFSSALRATAHDSDARPAALTYSWSASSGTLSGG